MFRNEVNKTRRQLLLRTSTMTLVELMVAISIVMVLASFLKPALTSAMEASRTLACLKNQKTLGSASFFFIEDHDDQLPTGLIRDAISGIGQTWDESILNYFHSTQIPDSVLELSSQFIWRDYKRNYGDQPTALVCPNHSLFHKYVNNGGAWVRSYILNGLQRDFLETDSSKIRTYYKNNGPSYINTTFRSAELPGQTFYLSEAHHANNMVGHDNDQLILRYTPEWYGANASQAAGTETLPHNNYNFNFLYLDGHASTKFVYEYGRTWDEKVGPWTIRSDD